MNARISHLLQYAILLAALLAGIELLPGQELLWKVEGLTVLPQTNGNGTNVFAVYDKTGTNAFRINPTNAVPQLLNGTNIYSGVTTNLVMGNTNRTLIIYRGLVIRVD